MQFRNLTTAGYSRACIHASSSVMGPEGPPTDDGAELAERSAKKRFPLSLITIASSRGYFSYVSTPT